MGSLGQARLGSWALVGALVFGGGGLVAALLLSPRFGDAQTRSDAQVRCKAAPQSGSPAAAREKLLDYATEVGRPEQAL
jgi:hypothetical protein